MTKIAYDNWMKFGVRLLCNATRHRCIIRTWISLLQ